MSLEDKFISALQKMISESIQFAEIAIVQKVSGRTCDVVTLDDVEYKNCRLTAGSKENDGIIPIPQEKSAVIIAALDNSDNARYVALCSKLDGVIIIVDGDVKLQFSKDSIVMDKGANGGLIIHQKLQNELTKDQQYAQTLKTATETALKAIDALIPGTSAVFSAAMMAATKGDYSNITNDKIKH
jgi:hypothetical protein